MNLPDVSWIDAVILLAALVGLLVAVPLYRRRRRRKQDTQ
jgi:hypothetical protein